MRAEIRTEFTITNHMPQLLRQLDQEIERRMLQATYIIHGELVKILSGSRTGRRYKVPATGESRGRGRGTYYTASAAGEAPAQRLADLRQSYRPTTEGNGHRTIGVIGSPLPYAKFLEFGTSRIRPRPHVRVAFANKQAKVEQLFKDML